MGGRPPFTLELPLGLQLSVRAELLKAHLLALKTQPCQEHARQHNGSARDSGRGGPLGERVKLGPTRAAASVGQLGTAVPRPEVAEATAAGYG